jgi:hypothetical protein
MSYYWTGFITLITTILLRQIYIRYIIKQKIIVTLKDKDGGIHEQLIHPGKNQEVEKNTQIINTENKRIE